MNRRAFLANATGVVAIPAFARATGLESVRGDSVIRAPLGGSEVVITTTDRLAGAIHSVRWGGEEFIDSADHGRQLQSASNFDCDGEFHPETFNPTEAGSRRDGAGPTSSSRLMAIEAAGAELATTTNMAFWLVPGEESGGHPACNRAILSDHLLTKRVRIAPEEAPGAIRYEVTFRVPEGRRHTYAQFEALTGYMPPGFGRFWAFDREARRFVPLDDGPGEQPRPVAFSTEDGGHAMGIYAPPRQPTPGCDGPGYGRFRFLAERVVKWNAVFRRRDPDGIAPGDYRFLQYVAIGTLEDVRRTLTALDEAGR